MSALLQYEESLVNYPARGTGLHQHAMRVANLGVLAELDPESIIRDMEGRLDGIRRGEAADAVVKASRTDFAKPMVDYRKPTVKKGDLNKFIEGYSTDMMDLTEESHVRLLNDPDQDAYVLINHLYEPEEFLFIGDVFGREVKTAKEWLDEDLTHHPHIIPNPMTGEEGLTDAAKISYRCENTVKDLRYAVCEMDEVPLDKQVGFWMRCISKLNVSAIIHSGSKSLHGWIRVDCGDDVDKWNKDVKGWLFEDFGVKYGLDRACSNKARLSRLPGHYRDGKEQQRLLYLGDR